MPKRKCIECGRYNKKTERCNTVSSSIHISLEDAKQESVFDCIYFIERNKLKFVYIDGK